LGFPILDFPDPAEFKMAMQISSWPS